MKKLVGDEISRCVVNFVQEKVIRNGRQNIRIITHLISRLSSEFLAIFTVKNSIVRRPTVATRKELFLIKIEWLSFSFKINVQNPFRILFCGSVGSVAKRTRPSEKMILLFQSHMI